MKTLPTRSILLVAGLGVWTLVSTAQAHPSRGHRFDRFDTDGDGRLTRAEVDEVTRKRVDALFERMDADDSGQVTADELEAVRKERKAQEDDRSKRRRRWRRRRAREAEVPSTSSSTSIGSMPTKAGESTAKIWSRPAWRA
jgi:hypothetical protein